MSGSMRATRFGCWILGVVMGAGAMWVAFPDRAEAVATSESQDFAIATGMVGPDLEAVYILDFKTHRLLGTVMNNQNGQFQSIYERNLLKDFNVGRSNPKYTMVTGLMSMAGNVPIRHVLYVAEANTGRMLAYGLPYRGVVAQGNISSELVLIGGVPFRQGAAPVRNQ